MSSGIFDNGTMNLLKAGLDAYVLRQKVIAENIANAETSGYSARSVEFEDLMQQQTESGQLQRTRPGHAAAPDEVTASARVSDRSTRTADNGINNVSVDMEMAALAETNLSHKMAVRALSVRYQLLRSAIRGRGTP